MTFLLFFTFGGSHSPVLDGLVCRLWGGEIGVGLSLGTEELGGWLEEDDWLCTIGDGTEGETGAKLGGGFDDDTTKGSSGGTPRFGAGVTTDGTFGVVWFVSVFVDLGKTK